MDNGPIATNNTSFYIKRIIGLLVLIALSATFFFSAYTKSGIQFSGFHVLSNENAFDSFQWSFLDIGISSINVAGILARLMIGFELMLGFFLLFHIFLKPFTYNAVIIILSIFIIYLLIVILKQGNTGNCGCFGNKLQMTPMQAIWKNLAMIAATFILKKIYSVNPYTRQNAIGVSYIIICILALLLIWFIPIPVSHTFIVAATATVFVIFLAILILVLRNKEKYNELLYIITCCVVFLISFCAPFLVNPVFVGTNPQVWNKPLNLAPLYAYTPAPATDLRKGKHIIAFMSLTCPHCKKAAYLLHIIHEEHPDIPIYMVLDGPEPYKKQFFDETHADNVPYLYYRHTTDFVTMAGTSVPSIYWVNNDTIEYKSVYAYYQLDPGFMEEWLHK